MRCFRIRMRWCQFIVASWAVYSLISAIKVRIALVRQAAKEPDPLGREKIFIAGIHWNNEKILRDVWVPVVIQLASQIGPNNVFVSVQESGSWDDSKGALRFLDEQLAVLGVPKKIVLDNTTHLDEISQAPGPGWLATPTGQIEMRRIPYLAKLRNLVLQPLLDMKDRDIHFDKILFLNDVAFNVRDVRTLLSTRGGKYAAACSLDFSKPPEFYDTFALRDSEGHEKLMQTWPYFRSRESRRALMYGEPVPVESCWNGLVAMDASPFYDNPRLRFRAISDDLAASHVEGSECCLIHADNPLSKELGVWLNPNVRVGYSIAAYMAVNPTERLWLSFLSIFHGLAKNRLLRCLTVSWLSDYKIKRRLAMWELQDPRNHEGGSFCLIDEMQVLVANGWAHR